MLLHPKGNFLKKFGKWPTQVKYCNDFLYNEVLLTENVVLTKKWGFLLKIYIWCKGRNLRLESERGGFKIYGFPNWTFKYLVKKEKKIF